MSVATDSETPNFVAATSEAVIEIERVQEEHQQGPCVAAFQSGQMVVISAIADLDRWPSYRHAAADSGFVAVVGIPLAVNGSRVGSLNVYDTKEREWSPDDLAAAGVLADIATAYIVRAGELTEARRLSAQLQHALNARIVIEQAKGMLARDHDLSVDEAFELLRRHARSNNVSLRSVGHAIVELGLQLPPPRAQLIHPRQGSRER